MISSQTSQSQPPSSLSSYFTKKPTRSVKHHETLTIKKNKEKSDDYVNDAGEDDVLTAVIARTSKIQLSPHAAEFSTANGGDSGGFTFSFSEGSINEASKKTLRRRQRRRNTTKARKSKDGESDEEEKEEGSETPLAKPTQKKAQPIPTSSNPPLDKTNTNKNKNSIDSDEDEEELYTTPEEALKAMASEIPVFDPEVDTIGPMLKNEDAKQEETTAKKKKKKKMKKSTITTTTTTPATVEKESELTPLPPKPIFSPTLKPLLPTRSKMRAPPGYEHFITTAHTLGNGSINFNEDDIDIGRRVDWGFVRDNGSSKDKDNFNASLNLDAGAVKPRAKSMIPIAVVNKARLMERKAKAKNSNATLASAAGAGNGLVGGQYVDYGEDNGVIGGEEILTQTKSAFGFGFNF